MKPIGKLYLIPSLLGGNDASLIPKHTIDNILCLDEFVVENLRSARRFLRFIGFTKDFDKEVTLHELSKNQLNDPSKILANLLLGKSIGLLSEAGNPCIADPGNIIVAYAHERGAEVVPLIGPNSILMALIASGFNGQQFSFHGYLPIHSADRIRKIKALESELNKSTATQIFMETPFRNDSLLKDLLENLQPNAKLCIACDITLETEFIKTKTVVDWRKSIPELHKRYCIFVLGK